jgi:hypothetical protein
MHGVVGQQRRGVMHHSMRGVVGRWRRGGDASHWRAGSGGSLVSSHALPHGAGKRTMIPYQCVLHHISHRHRCIIDLSVISIIRCIKVHPWPELVVLD